MSPRLFFLCENDQKPSSRFTFTQQLREAVAACGYRNSAPAAIPTIITPIESDPVNPGRLTYDSKYAGSTVSARPDNRIPSIVACQTFSR